MPWTNPERLSIGESVGGATGAGPLYTDANGILIDPGTATIDGADLSAGSVTLAKLANLANATVIGRNTAGTGVPEAVTMTQLAALLKTSQQATAYSYSVLQTFAASLGLVFTPGSTPGSLADGQMWAETDGSLWFRSSGATLPLIQTGTFVPAITFSTPGNLSVSYTTQTGQWRRMGKSLFVAFRVTCSAFTHTTASGTLNITGLPFTLANNQALMGSIWPNSNANFSLGIANQDVFIQGSANTTLMLLRRSTGSTTVSTIGTVQVGQCPTGNLLDLGGSGYIGEIA